jgi:hypothetical protein
MVDNSNPTNQFHPYTPETSTPSSERLGNTLSGGLGGLLNRFGLSGVGSKVSNVDYRGQLDKARGMARNNPGAVLGGLAALVIGAGLMRKRSMGRSI